MSFMVVRPFSTHLGTPVPAKPRTSERASPLPGEQGLRGLPFGTGSSPLPAMLDGYGDGAVEVVGSDQIGEADLVHSVVDVVRRSARPGRPSTALPSQC